MFLEMTDMSPRDRTANAAAVFLAAEEGRGEAMLYAPPRVLIGGAQVDIYARDGVLVVEVETEGADPEVFDMSEVGGRACPAVAVNLGAGRPLVATAVPGGLTYTGRRRKVGA
jgi:hypothetical protein